MNLNRMDTCTCKSYMTKFLEDFEKMTRSLKPFPPSISKSLYIHLNHAQNVSSILLRSDFVIDTNEWSIACKYFR